MTRAGTWWAGLAMAILSPALWGQEPPVKICLGEGNEWAPFTYWERKDGVPDTSRLTGSATTLVLDALQQSGLSHQIRYLPWARVQQELADYRQNGLCELTWDASYKPERAEFAFYSVPLYYTHLGFFYLKRRYPEPPDLQTVNRSRVCGVIGYNYTPYGLAQEPRRVKQLQQALDMLERDRCDFLPSEIEPLVAGISLGIYRSESGLLNLALPSRKGFYLLVSKGSPRGHQLVNILNQSLVAFQEGGHTDEVMRRFLPPME
ncbi:substrate-binding periplasmic protein [Aeromonas sp. S11(2024)]|uniref:substrate-binding periplasmic protein n=1 Tax=unclassified Aeromonas TaxID=257493 RepID=UPI003526E3ED